MGGSGDRWLLLHGTPLTPAVWDGVAAILRPGGQVLCPAVTPANEHDRQADLAARLAAALPTWAGPTHVVGHSFGGQVALDLAMMARRHVATLTLVCSRDTPYPQFAAAADRLRAGQPVDVPAALRRWFTAAELARGGPVVDYARMCVRRADRRIWAAALDDIARYDRAGRVGSICAPVTLIAAELDQVSTPAAMTALADRLRRATLHVLPGAAHLTPFTDPAALVRLVPGAAGR